MENSLVRQRYTRRPIAARRRRRIPRTGRSSLQQIIARQMVICVILLTMIGIFKNINISATNFVTDQVKYILNHNIELKNIFSYIDKLAGDIRKSIAPATAEKSASSNTLNSTDTQTSSGTPTSSGTQTSSTTATSSGTQTSSTTPTSTEVPAITDAKQNTVESETDHNIDTAKEASSTKNEAEDENGYATDAATAPETAVLSASSEDTALQMSDMLVPVEGTLSSLYGQKTGSGNIHNGIDINVKRASDIKAVLDGKVTATGSSPTYGNYIRIMHMDGLQTVYANCYSLIAKKGDYVKSGDIIANIGDPNMFAGVHLHFEVWKDGEAVDPLEYISVPVR